MQIIGGEVKTNELNENSKGGSERIGRMLAADVNPEVLKECQIFVSRVRGQLDDTKIRILLCQDLANDPESQHLKNEGWRKFHRIVFVSHWQREQFVNLFKIPYSRTAIIRNAVAPFENIEKPNDKINLIYHTTPHRGLEILVPVFQKLCEKHNDIHLDVFSSFDIYGWGDRDKPYENLFKAIKDHEHMTYHGFQENNIVRDALSKSHIFAYPSIWPETSCMSLMEAMSAKCCCVHSDLAALHETSANWTYQYNFNENLNHHASIFYSVLDTVISIVREQDKSAEMKLNGQKSYADLFYNWDVVKHQWNAFLGSLLKEPRQIEVPKKMFNYKVT